MRYCVNLKKKKKNVYYEQQHRIRLSFKVINSLITSRLVLGDKELVRLIRTLSLSG